MTIDVEALKNATDIVSVVGAYVGLKKRGAEFLGLCPFHADANPSFYVIPAKRFCNCFGCGWSGDVIDFLREKEGVDFKTAAEMLGANVEWKPKPIEQSAKPLPDRVTSKPPANAGKPAMTIRGLGEPPRTWEYRDADGGILGYVARYETPEGKQIRCWTWGKRGDQDPCWACGHWNKPRPLYGLDRLAARPDDPVMVVEGEKAADAAAELVGTHYVVVTWPGGANGWKHAEFSPLAGRKVTLWPDADQPGVDCMTDLAAVLADPKGLGCSVKLINPLAPGDNPTDEIPEGWDAANALAEGWTQAMVYAWAKPRATAYEIPQPKEPNPAPQGGPEASPSLPPVSAPPAAAGPDAIPEQTAQIIALQPPPDDAPPLEAYASDPAAASRKPRKKPRLTSVNGNLAESTDPNAEPLPAELSEDAISEHFVQTYGEDWRFCTEWNLWLQWKDDGWHRDRRNEVSGVLRIVTRQALEWPEAHKIPDGMRQRINSKRTAWNARDLAAVDRRISILAEQLDADPMLLGVPGGVVDLRTGKMMESEREHYVTRRCTVAPAPGPHPLFDRVLDRACAGHDGMRDYLLRWFGYMLTGSVAEEAFMFLHGPGGSGKSTLIKCLTEIMGDYATTISMDALTESSHQRHSQEIAKLEGSRLVYASETEEGRRFKESLIKWLTGGDKVVAHRMRMDDREFKPTFKILIYGNSVPHLKSVGEEMRRRIHLVEYAGSLAPEKRDTSLKERLVAEYPAILATLIRGCIDWQDCRSLGKPESVTASVDQYLEGEDSMAAFLDDCVERDVSARALSGDVYRRYKGWATNAGEYVMSQKRLVQALRGRGFDQARSGGQRYITGLKLRAGSEPEPPAHWQDSDRAGYEVP